MTSPGPTDAPSPAVFEFGGMIIRVVGDGDPRVECLIGDEWHRSHLSPETLETSARRLAEDELARLLEPGAPL